MFCQINIRQLKTAVYSNLKHLDMISFTNSEYSTGTETKKTLSFSCSCCNLPTTGTPKWPWLSFFRKHGKSSHFKRVLQTPETHTGVVYIVCQRGPSGQLAPYAPSALVFTFLRPHVLKLWRPLAVQGPVKLSQSLTSHIRAIES